MFGCLWGRRGGRSVGARKGGAHCGQKAFGKGETLNAGSGKLKTGQRRKPLSSPPFSLAVQKY